MRVGKLLLALLLLCLGSLGLSVAGPGEAPQSPEQGQAAQRPAHGRSSPSRETSSLVRAELGPQITPGAGIGISARTRGGFPMI